MASISAFEGSVPANYDQYLGPLFFEPYAAEVVKRWSATPIKNGLELACGTGRLTSHLLQLVDTNGSLYATDLNEDMLVIARQKIQDPRVYWQVVDAQELPYDDESFDQVICQFGVMFFPDKRKAFQQTLRVLQPGGAFLFLTWDDVSENAISFHTQLVLQRVFPEDPPEFFRKGPYSYFDKDQIVSTLQEVGFHKIELTPVKLTSTASHIDDVLKGILEGSPLASYLEGRQEAKEQVRHELKEELQAYNKNGTFHFTMQALFCKGLK